MQTLFMISNLIKTLLDSFEARIKRTRDSGFAERTRRFSGPDYFLRTDT